MSGSAAVSVDATKKPFRLEDIFPFPIKKEGKCPICKKEGKHYHMTFFLDAEHIKAAEEYMQELTASLDESLIAGIKLASNVGPSDLSPKDIMKNLMEHVKTDPEYADLYSKYLIHHIPSLQLEFRYRTLGTTLFSNVKTKFRAFTAKWAGELETHMILGSEKFYRWHNHGIIPEEKADKEPIFDFAVKEDDTIYQKFLAVHEMDAKKDYEFLRTEFYNIAGLIPAFQKATKKLMESEPYADVAKEIKTRAKRPIVIQQKSAGPLLRSL